MTRQQEIHFHETLLKIRQEINPELRMDDKATFLAHNVAMVALFGSSGKTRATWNYFQEARGNFKHEVVRHRETLKFAYAKLLYQTNSNISYARLNRILKNLFGEGMRSSIAKHALAKSISDPLHQTEINELKNKMLDRKLAIQFN